MRVIYFKRDRVPIVITRAFATNHPGAQVLGRMKGKRKVIWMFKELSDARYHGRHICFDTIGMEESESFKLTYFAIRRPRSIRYGIELTKGRVLCRSCACEAEYEVFGQFRCKYHYRAKVGADPCPVCQPKPPISKSKRKRMHREAQAQEKVVVQDQQQEEQEGGQAYAAKGKA